MARDSLALDIREPFRPLMDAYVLDLLRSRTPTRVDAFETLDGQRRLMLPLTRLLTTTAPRWVRAMLPVAEQVTKQLLHHARAQSEARPAGTLRRIRPQLRAAHEFAPRLDEKDDSPYHQRSVTQRKRTVAQVRRSNRRWEQGSKRRKTREYYVTTVVHVLGRMNLSARVIATGFSNASCRLIRRGLTAPHPRQWAALAAATS